ncbi:pyridoxal phosphate-dependent transferase [Mrakia frigida]|uniref:threonine aldolase family protein n=1 Tax=Mrakia frigida TaxID=29902 RepID=UPI003FCBF5F5
MVSTPLPPSSFHSVTAEIGGEENVKMLNAISRDFRSDTIAIPSDAMLLAGLKASRGDDVYDEDPTTAAFEARVAKLAGKEAGLFCSSGTLTNQLAFRTWLTQPPHAVLCDVRSHVYCYESGGISFHSQAATTTVLPTNGHHLTLEDDVEHNLVLDDNILQAPTKVVALENTLSGTIFPQEEIVKIGRRVHEAGLILHLDGARIWNVAAEKGDLDALPVVLKELLDPFDSVSLCMSKGLAAPIGSVLVGPAAFIKKAKHFRKLFGGGVRQSGGLAASADFALTHNFPELKRTHILTKRLNDALKELGARLTVPAETNMIFYDLKPLNINFADLHERALALPNPIRLGGSRIVVHVQTSESAVDDLLALISEMKEEEISKGWTPIPVVEGSSSGAATSGYGSK